MTPSIDDIVESLRMGAAVGFSDGSFKDKFGTTRWILENETETERIMALIDVPEYDDDHDLYRGIVTVVNILVKVGNIEEECIDVGCDGLSVLNRSFCCGVDNISIKKAYFVFLSGLHEMLNDIDMKWICRYILGRQDNVAEVDLDRWGLLNIEYGYRAKWYISQIISGYRRRKNGMVNGMLQIRIHGLAVGTKPMKYIRTCIPGGGGGGGGVIFKYWVDKKKRIVVYRVGLIDWETQGKPMSLIIISRRHWVSKFVSG